MDPGLRRDDVRACVGPRAILYACGVISERRHPRGGGDLSKHRVERTAPLRHSLRPSRKRRVTSTRCAAWRSHRRHEKRMRSAPAPGAVVSKEKAAPWRAPRAGILNRPGQYGRCLTPPRVGTLCALITGRFATPGPRAVTPLCRRRSPAAHPNLFNGLETVRRSTRRGRRSMRAGRRPGISFSAGTSVRERPFPQRVPLL
jgi:hypothetical protein